MAIPSKAPSLFPSKKNSSIALAASTMTQRRFPLQGIWKSETSVFQDRVVVHTALDFNSKEFELFRYLQNLKKRLKRSFDQLEILLTVQDLTAI
jgi:hypothetical protein